jgi:hypothetical protein
VVTGETEDAHHVESLVQDIRRSGALEAAMGEAERFAARAKLHAAAVAIPETREMLEEVADLVCARSA